MENIFETVLGQILTMSVFMVVGYILAKAKVLDDRASHILSTLLLWVFTPAMNLANLVKNCTPEAFSESIFYALIGMGVVAAEVSIAYFAGSRIGSSELSHTINRYALTVPNFGYIGMILILNILGGEMLFRSILFTLPLTLLGYSMGMYVFDPQKKFSAGKLLTPTIISIIVGMAGGLVGLKLPEFFSTALDSATSCITPCAMLLTGIVLARLPLKNMFTGWSAYLIAFIRLIVIPSVIAVGLFLLSAPGEIIMISAFLFASPVGVNVIIFPEYFGLDSSEGAKLCLISNFAGIVTVPLMVSATMWLINQM